MTLVDGKRRVQELVLQQTRFGAVGVIPVHFLACVRVVLLVLGTRLILLLEAEALVVLALRVVFALAAGAEAILCDLNVRGKN